MIYTTFRPLLAASLARPSDTDAMVQAKIQKIKWPVYVTNKLDGIRCSTIDKVPDPGKNSVPVCRSLEMVPNDYVRGVVAELMPGFDGELLSYSERDLLNQIERPQSFHEVQSAIMSYGGKPRFKYHIFGCCCTDQKMPYAKMVERLAAMELPDWCVKVLPTRCNNADELLTMMSLAIQEGHEGICFRSMSAPNWKNTSADGRSTFIEQWLIKWKLFATSEAIITGFEEEMQNNNPAIVDARGLMERASHQTNMVGKGRLGVFIVTSLDGTKTFKIGSGFTADMRQAFWEGREILLNRLVTFRHQPHGEKDCPRIPIFVGIRDRRDL